MGTATRWLARLAAATVAVTGAKLAAAATSSSLALPVVPANAATVTLRIESWRYDDLPVWRDKLIPAFEQAHPDIHVQFTPTQPAAYDIELDARLAAGTAGDLVTCRPFDVSLRQFARKRLLPLNDLPSLRNFQPLARLPWSTDDGATTYCVPVASVIHGFIYNADALHAVGASPPTTWDEFFQVLQRLRADGRWIPLVLGTKDGWETATMGYQNIGPDFYHGEDGRKALLDGSAKLTDPAWVQPWRLLAQWRPFLGEGFEAQTYPDSQNLFILGLGAIYPSGSWEVGDFEKQAHFRLGVFRPPLPHAGDKCYISDHPDLALGANAASPHVAQARIFLEWVGSPEFATLYANALPGFFSLNSAPVKLASPLAREFVSWRGGCASTIRPTAQFLSRGTPNLEREFWRAGASVIDGTLAPDAAAQRLESVLEQTRQQLRKEHP